MSTLTNVAEGIDLSKPAYTYTGFQLLEIFRSFSAAPAEPPIPPQEPKNRWLTKKEMCLRGKFSMMTLDKHIREKRFPIYKPSPDRVLGKEDEFDAFIESTKVV